MSYWDDVNAGTAGSGWNMGQQVPGGSAPTGQPAAFSYTPGQALPADVLAYLKTAGPKVGGALQSTNGYTFAPTFSGGAASAADGNTRGDFAGVGINDGKQWYNGQNEYKYNADGTYGGFNPIEDPSKSNWVDKYGPIIAAVGPLGLGFGLAAAGVGAAGAGAGAAGGAGLGAGAATGADMSAFYGGLDAGATLGGGATAGEIGVGTAAMGAGAGAGEGAAAAGSVFNPAVDSQLASTQLGITGAQAGADAAAAGIPSVSIPGSGISSALSSLGVTPQQVASNPSLLQQVASKLGMDPSTLTSLIGPAASLAGGAIAANGAKSAADTQVQAARDAAALQEPFRQGGIKGLNRLLDLYGLSGNTTADGYGSALKKFSSADFTADPGYQFRLDQGQQALDRRLSASGSLYSGKALKDAMNFNQGQASQEYGNAYNRYGTDIARQINPLQALAGQGQSAANTIGDYTTQAGNAAAAGQVGTANAFTNAIGQGYSMYQQNNMYNQQNQYQNALLAALGSR